MGIYIYQKYFHRKHRYYQLVHAQDTSMREDSLSRNKVILEDRTDSRDLVKRGFLVLLVLASDTLVVGKFAPCI
jgi:hypothetical protein